MHNRHHKLSFEIQERYKLIRAFHTCYYTQLNNNLEQMAVEFFFLMENIFEGKPIQQSDLHHINLQRVKNFLKEER